MTDNASAECQCRPWLAHTRPLFDSGSDLSWHWSAHAGRLRVEHTSRPLTDRAQAVAAVPTAATAVDGTPVAVPTTCEVDQGEIYTGFRGFT